MIGCFKGRHKGHNTQATADRYRSKRVWWCGMCAAQIRTRREYDAICPRARYGPGGTHWLPWEQLTVFLTGKTVAELEQAKQQESRRAADEQKRGQERSAVREAERIIELAQGQARPSWRAS